MSTKNYNCSWFQVKNEHFSRFLDFRHVRLIHASNMNTNSWNLANKPLVYRILSYMWRFLFLFLLYVVFLGKWLILNKNFQKKLIAKNYTRKIYHNDSKYDTQNTIVSLLKNIDRVVRTLQLAFDFWSLLKFLMWHGIELANIQILIIITKIN